MKIKHLFQNSQFIKAIFIVAIFILLFIASVSYRNTYNLMNFVDNVKQTNFILNTVHEIQLNLVYAENENRAYIISKDTSYLNNYKLVKNNTFKLLDTLAEYTSSNYSQHSYCLKTISLVKQRFDIIDKNIEKNSKSDVLKMLNEGKWIMTQIKSTLYKITKKEKNALNENQSSYDNSVMFTPFFTLITVLFTLAVFLMSYRKINKDVEKLILTNKQLEITNESIKTAEVIVNFAIWHCDYATDKITFSDNQYTMLGYKINEHDLTLKDILNFVHPDDLYHFKQELNKMLTHKQTTNFNYRMICKNGDIHYYLFMGKVIKDKFGNEVFVGINKDITERQINLNDIEERNKKLEQTNNELASFNHIASHDLQEPLRKIQTYISRIKESEAETLTLNGKNYFSRIDKASSRMRKLIDDLLLFSRASRSDSVFEITDLNELMLNTKIELAQDLEEKNTIIENDNLPTLRVIPFQIQQLFTNIMSNAIKYSSAEKQAFITIKSSFLKVNDEKINGLNNNTNYYKISIKDNGIGFSQEQATSIFGLFYRLHQNDEYPGTGIGLAICKKIVENHIGYIEANSEIGIGSEFNIYLPA